MDASFHAVQRRLAAVLPDAETLTGGGALELSALRASEAPRLDPPELIEGKTLRAISVSNPVAHVAAFLDGTQTSRVVKYVEGIPIVHSSAAAVIRERKDRRLSTWRHAVRRHLYAPLSLLNAATHESLAGAGVPLRDTGAKRDLESIHPFALQDAALGAAQRDRETLERELAEAWCAERNDTLLIDGSISDSPTVSRSPLAIGVVKSHQRLYVHGDDLLTVLRLGAGERTSVTRIARGESRTPVASWYLRLRGEEGRDPLWGLVRVEIAEPDGSAKALTSRADEVSRWVLAEALPLALPDGRWDKMVYGIRDCEEFLRAIQ